MEVSSYNPLFSIQCQFDPQVFSYIFPDRFRHLLQNHSDNLLVLLTCGGVVAIDDSRMELSKFALT